MSVTNTLQQRPRTHTHPFDFSSRFKPLDFYKEQPRVMFCVHDDAAAPSQELRITTDRTIIGCLYQSPICMVLD